MTGANLAPDTARELSVLKRRVTDLERMLDRVRRDNATPAAPPLPPFAAIEGAGISLAGGYVAGSGFTYYRPANPITATVTDPTGHLAVDIDPAGIWRLRVDITGIYEIGAATTSGSYTAGRRFLTVEQLGVAAYPVANVSASTTTLTITTGSRVVTAAAGSVWTVTAGDEGGAGSGIECTSLWARLVSTGRPVAGDAGSL